MTRDKWPDFQERILDSFKKGYSIVSLSDSLNMYAASKESSLQQKYTFNCFSASKKMISYKKIEGISVKWKEVRS